MTDWIGDPHLSAEEKLARFEALGPEPTRGPLPGNAKFVKPSNTIGGTTNVWDPRIPGGLATVEAEAIPVS